MTAKDHSKLLGIFFAVQSGLAIFGAAMVILIYGGLGAALVSSRRSADQTMGTIFLIGAVIAIPIGILFVLPSILAAYKLLKQKSGARFWTIFAAIVALVSFPLGTVLGVYALWFLFSEDGKRFFNPGGLTTGYNPPPPPSSWQ